MCVICHEPIVWKSERISTKGNYKAKKKKTSVLPTSDEYVAPFESEVDIKVTGLQSEVAEASGGLADSVDEGMSNEPQQRILEVKEESAEFLEECHFDEGEGEGVEVKKDHITVSHGLLIRRNSLDRLGGLHMVHKVPSLIPWFPV